MCDGTNQTGWECMSEFSTDDEGVAQVDPWCQSRGFGLSGGSTTIRGTARDVPGPHCGEQTLQASRPAQVVCTAPTAESTSPVGWNSTYSSLHDWTQTLSPSSTNFTGRVVTEQDPGGGGPDTCHFTGSIFSTFTTIAGGTDWTVTSGNHWGADSVGWIPDAVIYYRGEGRAPCGTTFPQRMVISCPNGGTLTYANNTLGGNINATTVTSTRAGQTVSRTWP
jgi:hypothetical protein